MQQTINFVLLQDHRLGTFIYISLQSFESILITPETVRFYAPVIHSSATINDRSIHFSSGSKSDLLLQVPIAVPNRLPKDAKIRVTVGVRPAAGDNDPWIGITDGTKSHRFAIINTGVPNSSNVLQCGVHATEGTDERITANVGNPVPSQYTMLFDPFHRSGFCSNNGGYSTAAKFHTALDATKGLDVFIQRDVSGNEEYDFHYILVEFL